jgi:type I restriction enzyme R subunit
MTTGVDCKTTKLLILDSNINSMTEFKQIIGRGSRLYPEFGKNYFTIMDFRDVCRLFADPQFDGDPVVMIDGGDGGDGWTPEPPVAPGGDVGTNGQDPTSPIGPTPPKPPYRKIRVRGVEVTILNERVQYYDKNGKLITESIRDYSKRNILNEYATMDDFIHMWTTSEKKQAIIDELQEHGVLLDSLRQDSGKEIDDFDLILHVAFDKKPLTKQERVDHVIKKGYLSKYSPICQQVLSSLLDKYMDGGISDLEGTRILDNAPFDRYGSPKKIASQFGGKNEYIYAVRELQNAIYQTSAN